MSDPEIPTPPDRHYEISESHYTQTTEDSPKRRAMASLGRWIAALMAGVLLWVMVLTIALLGEARADRNDDIERQRESCAATLERDERYEEIDRELWVEVVRQTGDDELANYAIEFIARKYDELPLPAACVP